MKLLTAERVNLLSILPQNADFVTLKIKRDLESDLALTEEEIKQWEVKSETIEGRMFHYWNDEGAKAETEIKMGEKAMEIIKESLIALDKEKLLPDACFSLYEKFVINKE